MYRRIKEILDESGLNQQEFSERIAIAPATLSNILKGRQSKYNTELVMSILAEFPEISMNWLMTGRGEKYEPKADGTESSTATAAYNGTVGVDGTAASQDGEVFGSDGSSFSAAEGPFSADVRFAYNSAGVGNGPENAPDKNGTSGHAANGARTPGIGSPRQSGSGPGFVPPINPQTGKPMTASEFNQMVSYFSGGINAVNPAVLMAKNIDKQIRKIREIRVYFDDDTFEVFTPSKG